MISLDEARKLARQAEDMQFDLPPNFDSLTLSQMAAVANGIGPEAFPEPLRKAIDARHPVLKPVAFIHDIEWDGNDGTRESFLESNRRFLSNGVKAACATYSTWRPGRYLVMWDAYKL